MGGNEATLASRDVLTPRTCDRFRLRRVLGRGGFGVVYEAYDRQTRTTVALKALRDPSGARLYQLKREFRALADLRHDNLVQLLELHGDDRSVFFTMELVHGVDFLTHVRPAATGDDDDTVLAACGLATPDTVESASPSTLEEPAELRPGSLDLARLCAVLPQLARGLEVVHRAGRIHRDIKPSNVLVDDGGRLVLLDFGLVAHLRDGHCGGESLRGTVSYMSPEQAAGAPLSAATDLYSVGVMLFEALTGMRPFRGPAAVIARDKQRFDAPRARSLSPEVPPALDELCAQLLARDPGARPGAAAVLAALGERVPEVNASAGPDSLFVGRASELDTLADGLRRTRAGAPVAVLVEGPPGIGKTALVERFLASHDQSLILRGRCYEQEILPFKAFDGAIDDLSVHLAGLEPEALAAVMPPDRAALFAVFPVLGRISALARATPLGVADQAQLRVRAFEALAALLRAIASARTVVIALDDLQWADDDSVALLDALLVRAEAPILVVATRRPNATPLALSPAAAQRLAHVPLVGLDQADAARLVGGLGGDVVELGPLVAEAQGHPLMLQELAHHHAQHGRHASSTLEEVLWERIAALDETPRRLLEIVGVAGVPVLVDVVAAAAGLEPATCLGALHGLRVARLVSLVGAGRSATVEPYHDRVREAIGAAIARGAASLDHRALTDLHLALGRLLRARHAAAAGGGEVFAVTKHLNLASERISGDERVELAALNLRAGRLAKRSTAYELAATHLAMAERLLGEAGWHRHHALALEVRSERMEVEHFCDRDEVSRELFEDALVRVDDDLARAELYQRRLLLNTHATANAEAVANGRRALMLLGERIPVRGSKLAVLRELVRYRWRRRGLTPGELVDRPLAEAPGPRAASSILMSMTVAAHQIDPELMSVVLIRLVNLALRHGLCRESSWGLTGVGLVMSGGFSALRAGAELGELSYHLNERCGDEALRARLDFAVGYYLAPWVEPFADAQARVDRGLQTFVRLGDLPHVSYTAASASALQLFACTDLARAEDDARRRLGLAMTRPEHDMLQCLLAHLWLCRTLRGSSPAPVRGQAIPASIEALRAGIHPSTAPIADAYAAVLIALERYLTGDADAAWHWIEHAHRRRHLLLSNPTLAELTLVRGLVAAERFDRAGFWRRRRLAAVVGGAARRFRRLARACPANFAARALLLAAERARLRGRKRRARQLAHAAGATARMHRSPRCEAMAHLLLARLEDEPAAGQARRAAVAALQAMGADALAERLEAAGQNRSSVPSPPPKRAAPSREP